MLFEKLGAGSVEGNPNLRFGFPSSMVRARCRNGLEARLQMTTGQNFLLIPLRKYNGNHPPNITFLAPLQRSLVRFRCRLLAHRNHVRIKELCCWRNDKCKVEHQVAVFTWGGSVNKIGT